MTKYVYSPFYPISDKLDTSHRSGWAQYWAEELGAKVVTSKNDKDIEFRGKDEIYLYHGMEWGGAMNLQSGLTDEIFDRITLLREICDNAKVFSTDMPMPAYHELLTKRIEGDVAAGRVDGKWKTIKVTSFNARTVLYPTANPTELIVGDSHALSMYRPGARIIREDGKTLFGALERGLSEWAADHMVPSVKQITLYYGNIDIRHHLLRLPDPMKGVKELVADYVKVALYLQRMLSIPVYIVAPLPIENESRVLPKTGWYKGAPFYGTWAGRDRVRLEMTRRMFGSHNHVYEHPASFQNENAELSFDSMEKPRSVHIRPEFYRLKLEGHSWKCRI